MQTEASHRKDKWEGIKKLQTEVRALLNQAKQALDKHNHLYQSVGGDYFLLEALWKKYLNSMPKDTAQTSPKRVDQLLKDFLALRNKARKLWNRIQSTQKGELKQSSQKQEQKEVEIQQQSKKAKEWDWERPIGKQLEELGAGRLSALSSLGTLSPLSSEVIRSNSPRQIKQMLDQYVREGVITKKQALRLFNKIRTKLFHRTGRSLQHRDTGIR